MVLDDEIGGLSVTLDDAVLRASPIWASWCSPPPVIAPINNLAALPYLERRLIGIIDASLTR